MPRKQSTDAKKARGLQKATGQAYTAALREIRSPRRSLAAELRAAGLAAQADWLEARQAWLVEWNRLSEVVSAAEEARFHAPARLSRPARRGG
ncbi:hypothetical protein [Kitasatospora sp. GP82]|uniref:hypothetical protein n=1 Tax=Kitasatospora sp. GP82 TaxID=3035089 RepID=UPI0024761CED|nr:hypothetical protein [Kitasatospora sp. GP82]MDH6130193.1 hypothetical protein [Kitasatospora sp. GP82]